MMTKAKRETVELVGVHGKFLAYADDLITRQIAEFGAHTRNENVAEGIGAIANIETLDGTPSSDPLCDTTPVQIRSVLKL